MIPDYQTLMTPVLQCSEAGEVRIRNVVDMLAGEFKLTYEEREELLPSGKQAIFANRVHWAKTYLLKAGLVEATRRGYFVITQRGKEALINTSATIDNTYLKQFDEFRAFQGLSNDNKATVEQDQDLAKTTPDEELRIAYKKINTALQTDILQRVRTVTPAFFEELIVELLLAMGYGGAVEDAGRALGRSGDNGVDGVIDQDPLGVDQIYVQAKRYAEGNNVGASDIRDFFGALNLKKAQKGIFITTSTFSPSAAQTAKDLGSRIVLIDGVELAKLMLRYNIGCRNEDVLYLKKIDEDFFES
ncbi:restriction endonuclease [Microbulbifer sp. THAF38]|uniref:restriction endonuclease n=1 Tax=Microbulbifer sp. THAF38 TaxID=2587856 RepID=UPI0012A9C86B|nr:restriction endonuclease [Microbulbifer sp. THAF38]QFT56308.1 Mrr restriction system protein [Microbulbifer sp. THAF38]